ncbi:response regulator [Rhodocytophaga rosea]|uniref:histidine kinase n=1 Tax=Rhodocytophaga rosea TaxID=2704465 RepID=A0A6C0GF09_9BACT|nr:ATP-binding protein [Rhodocytophaga rosea]QHT66394.1 response regulator [Rhodocytophaga rosea]
MLTRWIGTLLFFLPVLCCQAQAHVPSATQLPRPDLERGSFYFQNYTPKEYKASFQNWQALQNKQGILFFANGDGVLIYDGKAWTLVETPAKSVIRSMVMDEAGKVWVGALDDFGYLEQGIDGRFVYVSMLPKVKPEHKRMGNIWNMHLHKGLVYVEAETGIFSWNGQLLHFQYFPDPETYHRAFFWQDVLYLHEYGKGVMRLEGGKFVLATGGEFLKDKKIYTVLPYNQRRVLLATKTEGLFLYDGKQITPFITQADAYLKEKQIYTGTLLPDSLFAFGTLTGGVIAIDHQGQIRYTITKENGLPTNTVLSLATDRTGDVWLSLDNGISRVEISNGLNIYLENRGFEGSPYDICRYNGELYIASSVGLFVLRPAEYPNKQSYFEKIPQINSACWKLLPVNNRLLVASKQGVFEVNDNKIQQLTDISAIALHRYKADSTRILIAEESKLQSLRLVNGNWQPASAINMQADDIKFNETLPGRLWLYTFSQGAYLLSFLQADGSIDYDKPTSTHFGPKEGLPEGYIKMNSIGQQEIFRVGTESKLFRFNYTTNRFSPDTTFAQKFGLANESIFPVTDTDSRGAFWAKTRRKEDGSKQQLIISPASGNTYHVQRMDVSRILEQVGLVTYPEPNGFVWYAAFGGIVRQEVNKPVKPDTSFATYLNRILLQGDSVFFQGIGGSRQRLTFPYMSNAFRFEFTSTNFTAGEANTFQYKLEGFDEDWSAWTKETTKEYARIWEGNYTFLVRSRNYAGIISKPDTFSFVVAPPWFRSIYAYLVYALSGGLFMWGIVRWRSYQLRQEKEALKKEIALRTLEITNKNSQLEQQSEELRMNAEQLKALDKVKTNFFVNISHEFRTPLSLILSPLEKFIEEKQDKKLRLIEAERMHRNARRLQQLINQLLDLAKLESGGMKLLPLPSDFIYFLRVLISSFESLAENRNIRFELHIPSPSYEASFDKEKVETILYNLLSNAFKFTPDGGRIDFKVTLPEENSPQTVTIAISDTGPGIPPEEIDKIFNRFYQVDSSSSRAYEGSGIGLSLVKELVQLMHGTIEVQSQLQAGTTFTLELPLPKSESAKSISVSPLPQEIYVPNQENDSEIANKEYQAFFENKSIPSEALVLLVEDNADLRAYIQESLNDEYQIVLAENGKVGWEKAIELIPDVIISDMMMPVMDGFTLCTQIRQDERTSHIPFILLTARTTIENKLQGLELGADEYLTKPFNIKEVKVRIKNLLESRKNLRKTYSRELIIQPKDISVTSVDERFLEHALQLMEKYIGDEDFSVEKFAEEMNMSRQHLLRKIKALTGQSVNEFIRHFRLKRAAALIGGKGGNVSEIAYQVGFSNMSYFAKCFKDLFGVLPNEYVAKKDVN